MDRIDGSELPSNRLEACRVNRRRIHAAGKEIADFLVVGSGRGVGMYSRLQDGVYILLVLLRQRDEAAPDRVFGWDRIVLKPASICKLKKIITRFAGAIEIRGVKAVLGRIVRGAKS